ncbi:aminopeptidase P N-terminal domain-containing protein [Cecembia rubra]|uniref:Xaa-Pro aminopeptidase n=1 Tax=Cecembia rubra TaxID=1485585 RepID=A0A2P8DXS5_9BACT|nr:aminopeptidase P N-terminal domain-containing protein [Cecembia rubra]PSL02029.1 Xaa-Pro aminopeptidase [Cecembia rubra]
MRNLNKSFIILFFFFSSASIGQSYFKDGLGAEFHKERREALRKIMPENSVAIFFNNPMKNRSNDTEFQYRPNSDFFYLTGFREPNAALIIFKNSRLVEGKQVNEIIYVQPRDPRKEQWDGERLGIDGVKEKLGFEMVFLISDFLKKPNLDWSKINPILSFNMGDIEGGAYNAPLKEMVATLKGFSLSKESPSSPSLDQLMNSLRVKKTAEEMAVLKRAIEISGKAHIEAFKSVKPGVSERAIQGVHEFVHKAMGAESIGYNSIVGAGNNTTILHYVDNHRTALQDGLILMDVGAEFRGYSGDITRTVPVKGKFSPEEKAIYEIVLEALEAGISACQPGSDFQRVGAASRKVIDEGLVRLGLVKPGEKHTYFPHGIGHHLGLDVHDRGGYGKLEPGMVLTVEPGIYIPEGSPVDPKWWGIGVRIEDNILITEKGFENLSAFVPKTVGEIEALMQEEGILQKLSLD